MKLEKKIEARLVALEKEREEREEVREWRKIFWRLVWYLCVSTFAIWGLLAIVAELTKTSFSYWFSSVLPIQVIGWVIVLFVLIYNYPQGKR